MEGSNEPPEAGSRWQEPFGIMLGLKPIQTTQPIRPDESRDALSAEFLPAPEKEAQKAVAVSEEFQDLMDQLLSQYKVEMKCWAREVDDLQRQLRDVEGELTHIKSENELLKSESPKFSTAEKFKAMGRGYSDINQAMVTKHQHMKEVTADDILSFLDKEEEDSVEKLFKESDFKKLIKRSHTTYVPSETPEERAARLSQMSRLDRTRDFLQSNTYEMVMAIVLCVNVFWMALELQFNGTLKAHRIGIYEGPFFVEGDLSSWESAIAAGDITFTVIFLIDVVIRICLLGRIFFLTWMNYVDLGVVITSLVEITVFYATTMPVNPVLFRLLRIGKLARAFRMVHMTSVLASLQLLVKCLMSSANMLFWSFLLLTFVQCVAGLVISTLCLDFIADSSIDVTVREEVFLLYGTFSRTFLTMFEVLFANWGPACRVLMENVSEWFSVFFLFYRCILGFAVLNIINAVFVQQTMKTASSDEEIAFKQKEKDIQSYTRKVKKLFQTMDASGDGAINLTEFSKLVQSPKLKFWMGQLELEYHDLLSLFEFLDNGDGEITLMEFIDGAARLRGSAKALDIWRVETKVEVLFEEVLKLLQPNTDSVGLQSVQKVFNNSSYSHIKTTQMVRQTS